MKNHELQKRLAEFSDHYDVWITADNPDGLPFLFKPKDVDGDPTTGELHIEAERDKPMGVFNSDRYNPEKPYKVYRHMHGIWIFDMEFSCCKTARDHAIISANNMERAHKVEHWGKDKSGQSVIISGGVYYPEER